MRRFNSHKNTGAEKADSSIDKELEMAKLSDFDTNNISTVKEKWDLEKSYPLNIRIQKGMLAKAKAIAKEKGIPYQTLLKLYIADGIRHDKKAML